MTDSEGGSLPSRPVRYLALMVVPGERITDPDRAEALGLTIDAERMRRGTGIPDYMRLSGDEDCGVSLLCYHASCDPYHHGSLAHYSYDARDADGRPHFALERLGDFLDFIRQHAESHREQS